MRATRSTACMHMRANATCNQCNMRMHMQAWRVAPARPRVARRQPGLAAAQAVVVCAIAIAIDHEVFNVHCIECLTTGALLHCWSCVEIFSRKSAGRDRARKIDQSTQVVHRPIPITRFLPGLPLNPTSNKHWPIWIARGRSSEQESACFQARIPPVISETKVLVWLGKRSSCHGNRELSILLYTLVLTSVWLKASSDLEKFFSSQNCVLGRYGTGCGFPIRNLEGQKNARWKYRNLPLPSIHWHAPAHPLHIFFYQAQLAFHHQSSWCLSLAFSASFFFFFFFIQKPNLRFDLLTRFGFHLHLLVDICHPFSVFLSVSGTLFRPLQYLRVVVFLPSDLFFTLSTKQISFL